MRKRIALVSLLVLLIAAGAFVLVEGHRSNRPAGSTTPAPLSPATIYRLQVRVYLEPSTIVAAQSASPEALDRVIAVLDVLEPPADLAATHEEVVAGYRFIRDGRQIMTTVPRSDGEGRAEGEFLVAWGVSRLLGAAGQLSAE